MRSCLDSVLTAHLIRAGYFPDYANAALRLLPEWTQWCIAQSGLDGDFAARSRAAALTEAAALVDEETHDPVAERNEAPFRRQELSGGTTETFNDRNRAW